MENLKGLILSGGAGTRLRPITHTSAKQLVPVANKPVLFYGIEALVEAGVTEIGIVIAPQTGDEIREAVGDGSALGASVTYIPQAEPLGLAHAVLTAEEFIGDSSFVMYLGDNLLRDGITGLVEAFRRNEPDALILLTQVLDPEHYGVAELDGERIVRLVEKPKDPPSDLALVGVYMFTAGVFDAARAIEPSARGELEITDTIQHLVDTGHTVEPHRVKGWWKDTGQLADMLEANRLVLEDLEPSVDGELVDSRVEGRVVIEQGARVERSTRPRPRGDRRRQHGPRLLHRPLHVDRHRLRGHPLRGRALDPPRGRLGQRARLADGGEPARAKRADHARGRPAEDAAADGRRRLGADAAVRVLIAGADGMLAREVIASCESRGHEVAALDRRRLDITDPRSIERAMERHEPDAVINCAAWSDVDGAEDDERGATLVNDTGAGLLAAGAARIGASVLYPSSDYVFDGQTRKRPYLETDMPAPVGAYGRTKLGGEVSVAAAQPAPLHRPHLVALRPRRQELRRDDAAGRRRAVRGPRRQRPAGQPDRLRRARRQR